jgi:hypothetical protein
MNDAEVDDKAESDEDIEDIELDGVEEVDSGNENDVLLVDEEQRLKDVPVSSFSNRSQSTVTSKCFFEISALISAYLILEGVESTTFGTQKRQISSENDGEPPSKSIRNSYSSSVPKSVHGTLQRKVDSLEAEVLEYQTTWMRE